MRAILVALAMFCGAGAARACDATTPCEVANGRYFVRPPAGWDGRSSLPAAVFFHGYRSSAQAVMADKALGDALSRAGVLLVAPDGLRGSWTIEGRLSTGRDDLAFTRELVGDVTRRFPVDKSRLVATGFSAGGFMVWQLACADGELFAAYAPVSGAFLDPIPQQCPTGPVALRQIHGLADETVPMAGRWIAGGRVRQADVRESIARLRDLDECPAQPSRRETRDGLACEIWAAADCAGGREIQLCLHAGGHEFDPRWIVDSVVWAGGLKPPPPR